MAFDVVGLCGGEQTHDATTFAGGFGGGEESVLATDGDGPNSVFDRIVVDWVMTIVGNAGQGGPRSTT